jgi:hypothetical protein
MAYAGRGTRLQPNPVLSEEGGSQMAVVDHKVASPDGRTWSVTTSRRRRSVKESGQVPYFWAHVIVTAIMVVVFLFVLKSDVFKVLSLIVVIVFAVWLIGFLNSLFRVTITADTVGPPVDHRLWVVTKRRRREGCVRELDMAIQRGQDAREPEGVRLEEI